METGLYSASKAALNSITRKIHFEEEWLGMSVSSILFQLMLF
jgi:NAD(P)-dependent dehydrogenase (short-subunit alcohol dehydrogenase family)